MVSIIHIFAQHIYLFIMTQIFLIVVVVLFILAIADLVVGVSNDAVNFLNSAVGAKAASFTAIMAVSVAGIMVGTLFSSGMMEIARSGVFHPNMFYFTDMMYIFLAVMITDVLLLDTFSSFGLPTSTTVSIIFELLGAAVGIAMLKTISDADNMHQLGEYINSGKALAIISGILLSVVIAFTFGALVQYLSRLLFTFRFQDKMRYLGGIWGGIAITAITYFMVIKGAKGASFMKPEYLAFINQHTFSILLTSLAFWTLLFQVLIWLFKTNVLKITVLVGTFALAMAFAGNDLVNFIGVPLAGFESFRIFYYSATQNPETLTMGALMNPIVTPTYMLLIAGVVMSLTIIFSKKAKTVINTSVDLSRQDEGSEKFPSLALSRSIVRSAVNASRTFEKVTPGFLQRFLSRRLQQPSPAEIKRAQEEGISFDLVRASVNLVVASMLIAYGTSHKLPLSTTYVTFMVAMGTSFADGAWGRESAVYRISGVLIVIGGWFLTALVAFSVSFIMSLILYKGGMIAVAALVVMASYLLIRQHKAYVQREKEAAINVETESKTTILDKSKITDQCRTDIREALHNATRLYSQILDFLFHENLKKLRETQKDIERFNKHTKKLKNEITLVVAKLKDDSIETGHYYVQVLDFLREIAHCLNYISEPCLNHLENNHKGLLKQQQNELERLQKNMLQLLTTVSRAIEENDYSNRDQILKLQQNVMDEIDKARRAQVKRIKSKETGTKNSVLFLNILAETKNLALFVTNLFKSNRDFLSITKEQ